MPQTANLGSIWKIFSEVDISAIRDEAEQAPRLAMVGAGDRASAFQRLLQQGPRSAEQLVTAIPAYHLPLAASDVAALAGYELRVVLLDHAGQLEDANLAAVLAQPAPVVVVQDPASSAAVAVDAAVGGQGSRMVRSITCSLHDPEAVNKELLPAIVQVLPGRELAAGRAYPGLRPAVAAKLIQSASKVNAGYAAGTGLAEMVPGLGIPFAVADILILTKNQVVMAYKLGMLMGESGSLAEIIPKVAGVVGAGFMWRQVARELVGFLPLGVVLKTAVAYAGTYATGQAIYHYFVTGEKLRGRDLRQLFDDALARGRAVAEHTVARVRARREPAALLEPPGAKDAKRKIRLPAIGKRRPA